MPIKRYVLSARDNIPESIGWTLAGTEGWQSSPRQREVPRFPCDELRSPNGCIQCQEEVIEGKSSTVFWSTCAKAVAASGFENALTS